MKKMKKILAMLLALTMVLGMGLTAMAEDKKPEKIDTATATIEGIKEDPATIKLYQLVDAEYNEKGLTGYSLDNNLTTADLADFYNPTYTEIMNISKKNLVEYSQLEDATPNAITWTKEKTSNEPAIYSYSTSLEAGMYLVKIIGSGDVVYNPMIISIGYDAKKAGNSNTLTPGSVDATSGWELQDAVVAVKSSQISLTKEGTDSTPETAGNTDDTNVKVGDAVNYTVTTTIPSYSAQYTKVTFDVTDKLVNGLTYANAEGINTTPVVKVNNVALTANTDYTLTFANDGKSFTISFNEAYVKSLAGKTEAEREVVITYEAYLTADAITKYAENKVELNYTHKPDDHTGKKEATEVVNTVEIDGVIKKEDDNKKALPEAKFGLFTSYDANTNSVTGQVGELYKTQSDGDIYFGGLDADAVYYLKEIEAPKGYSLNDTVYKIEFTDLDVDETTGKLTSYKVKVTYVEDGRENVVTSGAIEYGAELANSIVQIKNTKINALPSTGGIGTTIFTVAGCGIMIAAAYFFFASRKKEN